MSVIVPVYNLERFLMPLLTSLKSQDVGGYKVEYIFVLNNCTDTSHDVIWQSGLPCTIMNCAQQGCGPARNMGFDYSEGEYIWFMDGDDWLLSDTAIKQALDRVKAEHLDILRIPWESNRFTLQWFSMVWQYVLRRDFVDGIKFPDYQPSEDDAYMDMVLGRAHYNRWTFMKLPCLDKPMYYYNYLREGSNMQRHFLGEKI